jgi:hypothetical protein
MAIDLKQKIYLVYSLEDTTDREEILLDNTLTPTDIRIMYWNKKRVKNGKEQIPYYIDFSEYKYGGKS